MAKYRFSLKSEELKGASQPNIIEMDLASDADATTFKSNLELLFDAQVATIDNVVRSNYALPYPAGTGKHFRLAMFTAGSLQGQLRLRELATGVDVEALCAQLVTDAIRLPVSGEPLVTSINGYYLNPGQYRG